MPPERFAHEVQIDPAELSVEGFLETRLVQSFDCGNKALNDFLNTEEVKKYEEEDLGKTYLVFHQGDLVAYFTVSSDKLRVSYLRTVKSFSKFAEMKIYAIPAVKIGRLAVSKNYQSRGIGRILVKYIAGMALSIGGKLGVRLLILQAKPESISFYEKCGFHLTREIGHERGKRNRTMYLDLHEIEHVA